MVLLFFFFSILFLGSCTETRQVSGDPGGQLTPQACEILIKFEIFTVSTQSNTPTTCEFKNISLFLPA
jgi:hypothetical protein